MKQIGEGVEENEPVYMYFQAKIKENFNVILFRLIIVALRNQDNLQLRMVWLV